VTSELLASRVAEGNPARVREVALLFEAAGAFSSQAQEARAQLPDMAAAFLTACLAEGDYSRLSDAVVEASVEGLCCNQARVKLQQLA